MVKRTNRVVVKEKVQVKPVKKLMKRVKKRKAMKMDSSPAFGPVTTIDTAPISIGNTFQGCSPVVIPVKDGVRIKGRDYLLTLPSVAAAITGWELVGGAPIAPACMIASGVRGYASMYAEYAIHGVAFHFITADSTATTGNIMMYVGKDRVAPLPNQSSANFLPFVLSDHNTVISPLWKNCTACFIPTLEYRPTDVLNGEDLRHQACGELMVYTKSSVLSAPGYVLIDYDITFRELSVNPKLLTLPINRMKYNQVALTRSGSTTAGSSAIFTGNTGTLLDTVTYSTMPPGCVAGDVYKIVFNMSASSLTGSSASSLLAYGLPNAQYGAITLVDGFTCYGVVDVGGVSIWLYDNYDSAMSLGVNLVWGASQSLSVQVNSWMSLVGGINMAVLQSNF